MINNLQTNFLDDVDYLMGTSAGAVNAAILAQDDKPTTQLERCIQVWREPRLFDNEPLNRLLSIYGLKSFVSFTKYKKSLSKYIPADRPLKALKKDALFTTFALDPKDDSPRSKPKIFNSADPKDEDELTLDVVLRSGSAAPIAAIHQGYADGGWYSANPSSHILPLFRWFTEFIAEDQKKLRDPLKKALEQDWFVEETWKPLYTGVTINDKSAYLDTITSLNKGKLPKSLHIPFFADTPIADLRGETQINLLNTAGSDADDALSFDFKCGHDQLDYKLTIHRVRDVFSVALMTPTDDSFFNPLYPGDVDALAIEVTEDEKLSIVAAVQAGELPVRLRNVYFGNPAIIDFAVQPVNVHTESPHYQWRVEPVEREVFELFASSLDRLFSEGVSDEILFMLSSLLKRRFTGEKAFLETLEETLGPALMGQYKSLILKHTDRNAHEALKFRARSTPEHPENLISFELLSYEPDVAKLRRLLRTVSVDNEAWEDYIWDLCKIYEKEPTKQENWDALHNNALNFLIRKMEPDTKLSLLSVNSSDSFSEG